MTWCLLHEVEFEKKVGAAMGLVSQSRIEEINQGHIHRQGNTDKFECDSPVR